MTLPTRQLLVFRFGPDSRFEGGLLGAAERIENGMALRVVDVLFVHRDAETGELEAISTRGGDASAVLDFRLDDRVRRETSLRTLADHPALHELGDTLEPGCAVAAFLVQHRWAEALDEAVERMGGTPRAVRFVDETSLRDLLPALFE